MKKILSSDIKEISSFLSVVCDETRLFILFTLMEKPLCVNEIVIATGKSQSLVSHQLAVLKKSGLVTSERKGNFVYYKLKDSCVESIINMSYKHVLKEGNK